MAQPWVYVLVAVVALHTLATVYFYFWMGEGAGSPPSVASDPAVTDSVEETVVCQNCGARNESGYRYCRECVTQLGPSVSRSEDDDGPGTQWLE